MEGDLARRLRDNSGVRGERRRRSGLRCLLTCNDPAVDLGGAVRALGRPVPGMFSTDDPSGFPNSEEARKILSPGPPLYLPDVLTDRTDRFRTSEVIRGALFQKLGKELPYCCEVRAGRFDESRRYLDKEDCSDGKGKGKGKRKSVIRIEATVLVERDSQRASWSAREVGRSRTWARTLGRSSRSCSVSKWSWT
ncbi:hypothetical protein ACHAWF_015804 [Thalassiosira exigua]